MNKLFVTITSVLALAGGAVAPLANNLKTNAAMQSPVQANKALQQLKNTLQRFIDEHTRMNQELDSFGNAYKAQWTRTSDNRILPLQIGEVIQPETLASRVNSTIALLKATSTVSATIGKYVQTLNKYFVPLSLQGQHAKIVAIQEKADTFSSWLTANSNNVNPYTNHNNIYARLFKIGNWAHEVHKITKSIIRNNTIRLANLNKPLS